MAIGGGAVGHYALGGGAAGDYVVSATRCDPEAQAFFLRHFEWLPQVDQIMSRDPSASAYGPCARR